MTRKWHSVRRRKREVIISCVEGKNCCIHVEYENASLTASISHTRCKLANLNLQADLDSKSVALRNLYPHRKIEYNEKCRELTSFCWGTSMCVHRTKSMILTISLWQWKNRKHWSSARIHSARSEHAILSSSSFVCQSASLRASDQTSSQERGKKSAYKSASEWSDASLSCPPALLA